MENELHQTNLQTTSSSMLEFVNRKRLVDIVLKLTSIDNISIHNTTNSKFIRK